MLNYTKHMYLNNKILTIEYIKVIFGETWAIFWNKLILAYKCY